MKIKIAKVNTEKGNNEKLNTWAKSCHIQYSNIPNDEIFGLFIVASNEDDYNKIAEGNVIEGELHNNQNFNGVHFKVLSEYEKKLNKLTFGELEILASRCFDIANELDKEHPEHYFDKILGVASIHIDFDELRR